MKIVAAISAFALLTLFDLPTLVKNREWRTLAVYSLIAAAAVACLICYTLDIETFSFIKTLSLFVEKTLKLNYELWQGHT